MEIVDFHEVVGEDLCVYATSVDVYNEGIWWRSMVCGGYKSMRRNKNGE